MFGIKGQKFPIFGETYQLLCSGIQFHLIFHYITDYYLSTTTIMLVSIFFETNLIYYAISTIGVIRYSYSIE